MLGSMLVGSLHQPCLFLLLLSLFPLCAALEKLRSLTHETAVLWYSLLGFLVNERSLCHTIPKSRSTNLRPKFIIFLSFWNR